MTMWREEGRGDGREEPKGAKEQEDKRQEREEEQAAPFIVGQTYLALSR